MEIASTLNTKNTYSYKHADRRKVSMSS